MGKKKKKFEDLTICDDFLFGTVMLDEVLCRRMIELAVGFPIERVFVVREKSMQFHPEYHGIRLDVYARDEENTHYDVEMQVRRENFLKKRTRYYHDQMDMELLESGVSYEELPDCYVIFICCFDPFGEGRYRYTVFDHCGETKHPAENGARTIYLSTKGCNSSDEPEDLINFLRYVEAIQNNKGQRYEKDPFISRLEERIREVKEGRKERRSYMLLELTMEKERKEGHAAGLSEGRVKMLQELICKKLKSMDCFSEDLEKLIYEEKSEDVLMRWYESVMEDETLDISQKL